MMASIEEFVRSGLFANTYPTISVHCAVAVAHESVAVRTIHAVLRLMQTQFDGLLPAKKPCQSFKIEYSFKIKRTKR